MKKILIADDEEVLRMLIADTLEDLEDVQIDIAKDGRSALEKLTASDYDLLLLDYMMPELSGMEVLERLPAEKKERMSIIMLTAKAQDSDRDKALAAGATSFIPKPFSPMELLQAVEDMLA